MIIYKIIKVSLNKILNYSTADIDLGYKWCKETEIRRNDYMVFILGNPPPNLSSNIHEISNLYLSQTKTVTMPAKDSDNKTKSFCVNSKGCRKLPLKLLN